MVDEICLPWQDWIIEECIDRGSYAGVYTARSVSEPAQYCAIKIIDIPYDDAQEAAVQREHPDPEERRIWYQDLADHIMDEIRMMERLRGNPNVAELLDHCAVPDEERLHWRIFLRMELLKPIREFLITEEMTQKDVLKLGTDLCSALEECERCGIIHRDIKPENILVDENGTFKLGDFGIARAIEQTTAGMSLKGTFSYMAPEVYHGENYDFRADQYSLGIVLYRLMNNNHEPFIARDSRIVSYHEREDALRRRMRGDSLPDPALASESFCRIIKKACAYRPENRFESAAAMKEALDQCRAGGVPDLDGTFDLSETDRVRRDARRRKNRRTAAVLAAAAVIIAVILAVIRLQPYKTAEEKDRERSRRQEARIEEKGIRKDNALQLLDISGAMKKQDSLNDLRQSPGAEKIIELIRLDEEELKKAGADGRDKLESCIIRVIYLDDDSAVGTSVNYTGRTDNRTNTESTQSFFTLYYYTKQNGEWFRSFNGDIPREVWSAILKDYLPEGCSRAVSEKRSAVYFPEGCSIGEKMVYNSNVTLRTGAVWTNEDGSADIFMICRNGTQRPAALYAYWFSLAAGSEGEILQVFGNLDPGEVTVDAGTMAGLMLHLEPEEVRGLPENWDKNDVVCYTAANNSNYQAG